jgi:hypothetical protein
MFIELQDLKGSSLSGAKSTARRIHLPVHCAPLERQTVVGPESINIWLLWSQNKMA